MTKISFITGILYVNIFFGCLKGFNLEKLEWLSSLCDYIKTSTDEYQVMIIKSANQSKTVSNPWIYELLVKTIENRPTLRLDLNLSSTVNDDSIYNGIRDTAGTFFILIRDSEFTDIKSLMDMIDLLKELSTLKGITKFLIIFISVETKENLEIIFQYTWKKQIIDITILEIPKCDVRKFKILNDCSAKTPMIHQFNPFLNSFTHEYYSSQTQWFPSVMKNLYGYPIKVALVHDPPFSFISYNKNLEAVNISGPDILVIKTLASQMNFTMKLLHRLVAYEHIRNSSVDELFKLLESDIIDVLAHGNPHYTETVTENAYRSGELFFDQLCALVPIQKEDKIPLSLSAIEAVIISTTIVIAFWIPAFILKFDRSCWSIFVIFRVLFGISVNKRPSIVSQRLLYTFLLLISFSYSSNIYASLTSVSVDSEYQKEYRNFDDLAKSSLTPMISKHLYGKTFSTSERSILELKKKVVNTTNIWMCPFIAEKFKNITCLMGKLESKIFLASKKSRRQNLKLTKVCFWSDSYTFLVKKGSVLRRSFKKIFLIFSAVGLDSKWYKNDGTEVEESGETGENSVKELFIPSNTLIHKLIAILLFGYIASGIAFTGEIIYNKIIMHWGITNNKFFTRKIFRS
ncbi:GSCOCG00007916001-RA-CDS [Cotesia congregata]|nr:GSCOCG00007916001-RA-CDS [Cotesia congregata]